MLDRLTNLKIYEKMFRTEKMPKSCLLCKVGELDELGHIIPKFVMRWLKQASKRKNFYLNNEQEQMIADTPAFKMMCKDCEDKFSNLEKHFTDNFFKKYYRGHTPNPIQDEVYDFAISIAWRLIVSTERLKNTEAHEKAFAAAYSVSESLMREYLNNKKSNCEQSVYVLPIESLIKSIPESLIHEATLKYSIRQGLKAHRLYDETGKLALTQQRIPTIHFKLGCYYFFVFPNNYFAGSEFTIKATRISETKHLYVLDYTPDLLGFMEWLIDGPFLEINTKDILPKNYTLRDAPTLWDIAFGSRKTQGNPQQDGDASS